MPVPWIIEELIYGQKHSCHRCYSRNFYFWRFGRTEDPSWPRVACAVAERGVEGLSPYAVGPGNFNDRDLYIKNLRDSGYNPENNFNRFGNVRGSTLWGRLNLEIPLTRYRRGCRR